MWFEQRDVCAATMIPTEPSTRASSSMAVTYSTYPIPAPPYSGGKIVPIRPSFPSSLIVASGNSQASSHFMTFGAISRSANSRTLFLRCSCSSFNWKSKDPPSPKRLAFTDCHPERPGAPSQPLLLAGVGSEASTVRSDLRLDAARGDDAKIDAQLFI